MSLPPNFGIGVPLRYGNTFTLVFPNAPNMVATYEEANNDAAMHPRPAINDAEYTWMYMESPTDASRMGTSIQSGDIVTPIFSLCDSTSLATKMALTRTGNGQDVVLKDYDINNKSQQWKIVKSVTGQTTGVIGYGTSFSLVSSENTQLALTTDGLQTLSTSNAERKWMALDYRGRLPQTNQPVNSGCGSKSGAASPVMQYIVLGAIGFLVLFFMLGWQ